MTVKHKRNIKIMEEIEYNRSRIAAARLRFAQASKEEQESQAYKLVMLKVEKLQAETDTMEEEFMLGTVKLKPGRKSIEDSILTGIEPEDSAELSNERRQVSIDNLKNKLAVLREQLETKELEVESLRLNLKLKERDFAKRIADIQAKIDGTYGVEDL